MSSHVTGATELYAGEFKFSYPYLTLQIIPYPTYNWPMRFYRKLLTVFFVVIIAACVTTPISNKSAFIMIPIRQEIALGKQAYNQILTKEEDSGDNETTALVKQIGLRLAKVSAMPNLNWEFRLIKSEQQNAFALPGGKVAVYTGLLPVAMN